MRTASRSGGKALAVVLLADGHMSRWEDKVKGLGPGAQGLWALFGQAVATVAPPQARLSVVPGAPEPAPLPVQDGPLLPEASSAEVHPLSCALELTLDPRQETFLGLVEFELRLSEPTQQLWLYGSGLTVHGASVSTRGGTRPARVLREGEERLGFLLERPVGPGPVTLRVAWQGRLSPQDSAGILRRQEGGSWYARARLAVGGARWVLPCFGEAPTPLPWQLTLRLRPEDRAFTERPVLSEEVGADGLRTVRFPPAEASEPLAFTVGPADTVAREMIHSSPAPAIPRGGRRAPTA